MFICNIGGGGLNCSGDEMTDLLVVMEEIEEPPVEEWLLLELREGLLFVPDAKVTRDGAPADWALVQFRCELGNNAYATLSYELIDYTLDEVHQGGRFGVMVEILAYYARGRGFDSRTVQTFDEHVSLYWVWVILCIIYNIFTKKMYISMYLLVI
jgi:hypothetical protein